ncbi:MAG: hypothetical protein M0R17_02100 [Candidatus Omnitrophica bacterium]|jgi:ribonucleoside-triphosphate reductase|nr:hypothetical protein [Candidatus Omnitrophota bacterium]
MSDSNKPYEEDEFTFSSNMFEEADTARTIKNIKRTLIRSLKNKFELDDANVVDSFLKLQGIHLDNFDFVKNIESIINAKLNDVSIDDNSNKNEKTVSGIMQEAKIAVDKLVGFDYLYRVCKELYGKQEAKKLMGSIYDYSLGLHDSAKILTPYCFAIDASKIVLEGRSFGVLPSKPVKRLSSYISALCETIHQLSNHVAGAIAIGTFFLDITHILIYKQGVDYKTLKEDKVLQKKIENEFQQFTHSVNHLSRSSIESPFSNLSIFDRTKLKAFISDDNMAWYFPFDKSLRDAFKENDLTKETYRDSVVEYIMFLQMLFLDFYDKGDPLNDGRQYRFPICTLSVSKQKNEKEGWEIIDKQFLKDIVKYEIYRYNIFSSEGMKVASCCRLINNVDLMQFGAQSNSFGGTAISLGSHRVVTINYNRIALQSKSLDEYYKLLDKRLIESVKILKAHKTLLSQLEKKGLQPFITNGWLPLCKMFSTFGVLGLVEAIEVLKKKFKGEIQDKDLMADILIYVNKRVEELCKEYDLAGNIEQIPGESFAVRLAKADKLIFGAKEVTQTLYSNQFIPLWKDVTIYERMDIDGKYNQLYTGGGIVHFTLSEKVTGKQAEKLIIYAIKSGCEHFALNAVYSECEAGHNSFGKLEICPVCSKKIVEYYTRVVGFFTPVSSWNKERGEWEFPKRVLKNID